jgi:putative ribosome biogenesis GTPase RsgA
MTIVSRDDILIAVLGVTGAGKTTFINKASGQDDLEVGHSLEACKHKNRLKHS